MPIDVAPNATARLGLTGPEAILQRVATLLATRRGTLPLDRRFGISGQLVDQPARRVAARIRAEIVDGLARYVPEVRVTTVRFVVTGEAVVPTVGIEFV